MNVGLIGKGYWGSIIEPKIQKYCNLKFIADSKTNYENFLDSIEWVFVCSPTHTHYDIVKKCLDKNKNVFCEKPFTGSFKKAKELINLAKEKNLNLFIDNIFLKRIETNYLNKNFMNICFIWNKNENIKENIYDSLLYHDLYLLINTSKKDIWNIVINESDNYSLKLILQNNNQISKFLYKRNVLYKEKYILLDQIKIDYSKPLNDPLLETIYDIKNHKIDCEESQNICLKTLNLLEKIKNYHD